MKFLPFFVLTSFLWPLGHSGREFYPYRTERSLKVGITKPLIKEEILKEVPPGRVFKRGDAEE